MLRRLPISLAQLNAGNNSEKLKNEIRQILYSWYRSKRITKNVYKSLLDIIQNMETIFMNNENSKTSEPHRFELNLTDKINLKNPNKNMALVNLSIYYTWKSIKSKYNKFKIYTTTWNETFDLPDGFNSISDIQHYFEFILKKHKIHHFKFIQIKSKTELFSK